MHPAIGLSLQVASLAILLTVITGLPVAWLLGRHRFRGHAALETAVLLPLVLPPTVIGYYLLLLTGRNGPLGRLLEGWGIDIAFTWRGAVVAAWIASFGLFVRAAQAGFEQVDEQLEQAARTLGRSGWSVFWSVTLPLARRGVLAGVLLGFCRALGEFGITLMVAGNVPGRTQTVPLAIYEQVLAGQFDQARQLALLTVAVVATLLVSAGRIAGRRR